MRSNSAMVSDPDSEIKTSFLYRPGCGMPDLHKARASTSSTANEQKLPFMNDDSLYILSQ